MTTSIEPSAIMPRSWRDGTALPAPFVLAAPPARPRFTCAHCHRTGTTLTGGLWRVSPDPDRGDLYFLHATCLAPFKLTHNLRSVEGRLPRALAPRKEIRA